MSLKGDNIPLTLEEMNIIMYEIYLQIKNEIENNLVLEEYYSEGLFNDDDISFDFNDEI